MKVVATHDGRFHADEVLAVSILKRVYPKIKIIRTRDDKVLERADILVDVGGKYDPEKGFFDHHQESFKEKRENGDLYASSGIIWKHFGSRILKDKKAWEYIDSKLVAPIDKIDVDSSQSPESMFLYTLDKAVGSFRPLWNSKNQDWNKKFNEALLITEKILDNEISIAKSILEAEEIVNKAIKEAESKNREYIFLPNTLIPFMEVCVKHPKIKYVISPYIKGRWHAKCVTKSISTYETRKPFPKSWGGLNGKDLERVSGIKGAFFCHKVGFIAGALSKESMIKMVEKSLKE